MRELTRGIEITLLFHDGVPLPYNLTQKKNVVFFIEIFQAGERVLGDERKCCHRGSLYVYPFNILPHLKNKNKNKDFKKKIPIFKK